MSAVMRYAGSTRARAAVALGALALCAGCGDGGTAAAPPTAHPSAVPAGRIGAVVHGTGLDVTVRDLSCGLRVYVPPETTVPWHARGRFCLVGLDVANTGRTVAGLTPARQVAYAADGAAYRGSRLAGFPGAPGARQDVAPGRSAHGTLVLDVPAHVKPVRLELHANGLAVAVVRLG